MAQHRAIVIGTGLGGAVASCRLAQAGFAVTVLERGRRYDQDPPQFPRGPVSEWRWDKTGGLFDVRPVGQVRVMQAAGYGGGSLIYANVHLRPPPEVFGSGWPTGYSRPALDPYFDLVAHMLDVRPITDSPHGLPPKTLQMAAAASALGRREHVFYPPLAIDFSADSRPHLNKFGVMQQSCTHVGECVIGCPRRAKNTLDLNYLAVAERLGADMRTECEVTRIEPLAGGEGYRVSYVDRRRGEAKETIEASYVFLCAGAVCSTTLLLQCRAAGALPRLSPKLGEGYSGNGDLLLLSFRSSQPWDPSNGPTITTGLVYSGKEPESWFLLEDGGFSRHLWPLFELADPSLGWRRVPSGIELLKGQGLGSGATAVAPPTAADVGDMLRRVSEAQPPGSDTRPEDGPPPLTSLPPGMGSTAMFLAMGRDLANGTIRLTANGAAMLAWDVPQNLLLYSLEERLARDLTGKLGGEFATSPFWRFAHLPASVHNLGGCAMGESPDKGVTNQLGEVWGHQNLFVMDGAILPAATGVNPSHTIAAVAERNIEQIIRRITGNPAWAPPERREVTAYPDPLSRVAIPAEGTPPPETPGLGLTMREAMIGYFRTGKAESITDRVPRVAVCRLRITIGYLARFLSDPSHPGLVTGNVYLGGLTAGEAEVQEGVWNLFVAPGAGPEREMRYVLPFIGQDGRRYTLRGTKLFVPHPGLRLWRENTVLDFRVHEGVEEDGAVVGEGKVRIGLFGVVRLLLSFRVTGQDDPAEKARAVLGFAGFYLRELLLVSWPSSALTRLFKVGF